MQNTNFRKYPKDEWKRREEEFRVLIDDAPDPVFRYDRDGVCVYSNHSAQELLQAETVCSDDGAYPVVRACDAEDTVLAVWQVVKAGKSDECESTYITAEGKIRVFHNRLMPEFGVDGEVVSVVSVCRDITAFKEALKALRYNESSLVEREREYRTLAENSPDSLARFDSNIKFVYVNPVFEKWTGMPRQSLLGKNPCAVIGLRIGELLQNAVMEAILKRRREEFEHSWELSSGGNIWCHINVIPEFDDEGELTYVQVSARNISLLKEAEKKIRESHDLLRRLSSKRELENEDARRSIAWEIYDTLGQHLMMLRMKLSSIDDGIPLTGAAQARDAVAEMLELADNAIRVVRTVSHELRPMTLDLGIEIALDWLADKYTNQSGVSCTVSTELPPDFNMNKVKSVDVFRIVEQAVNNAALHAKAQHISILLKPVRDSLLLEVRDDGIGFDLDEHWDEGLGLLDMRERAYRLEGELVFFTRIGGGTVVELLIPAKFLDNEDRETQL